MQIHQDQRDTPVKLTGVLDINTAAEVLKTLLVHLEHKARISVDLSQIESCDAAGIQLLLAMQRSAKAAGKPFALIAATEAFTAVCASLGISSEQLIAETSPRLEPECVNKESTVAQ